MAYNCWCGKLPTTQPVGFELALSISPLFEES